MLMISILLNFLQESHVFLGKALKLYLILQCHQILYGEQYLAAYIREPGSLYLPQKDGQLETLAWTVEIPVPSDDNQKIQNTATAIAKELGLNNLGQVGKLRGHYLFVHSYFLSLPSYHHFDNDTTVQSHWWRDTISDKLNDRNNLSKEQKFQQIKNEIEQLLQNNTSIVWFHQEVLKKRVKRSVFFEDPLYVKQWHLENKVSKHMDLNITEIWLKNITGRGVTVCVVDDGIEWTNPDLLDNYSSQGSWDLNGDDPDPLPTFDGNNNEHGTRCAGEIAAVSNKVCGVGVAYEAKISGIKILDGKMTDSLEATAFNKKMDINDIYSCSWGPEDDGKTVDGPRKLARRAIRYGTEVGRKGYGTIYVVASGNGGLNHDNCNYDGYANSIYTITVGAVDEIGNMPYYAEECASMIGVAFSSGDTQKRSIVTTDWTKTNPTGCTTHHTGTSAAAPLVAGMIALMLQVRPCLTWRDVQYILILTASKIDVNHAAWFNNSAGLHHSHKHGFGLLTSWRLVTVAQVWKSVPWMTTFGSDVLDVNQVIPFHPRSLIVSFNVTSSLLYPNPLYILEYAQVRVTLTHRHRGRVEISLQCPSGTVSLIGALRPKDLSEEGFDGWVFTTIRCWGEPPYGTWYLKVTDNGSLPEAQGILKSWQLILHGTSMTSQDFEDRQLLVNEAVSGKFLDDENFSLPCEPPLPYVEFTPAITEKVLKILALTGGFLFLLSIYQTFEYIACYDDEKVSLPVDNSRTRKTGGRRASGNSSAPKSEPYEVTCQEETSLLLPEAEDDAVDDEARAEEEDAAEESSGVQFGTFVAAKSVPEWLGTASAAPNLGSGEIIALKMVVDKNCEETL